jgi:hypothetical protein
MQSLKWHQLLMPKASGECDLLVVKGYVHPFINEDLILIKILQNY